MTLIIKGKIEKQKYMRKWQVGKRETTKMFNLSQNVAMILNQLVIF